MEMFETQAWIISAVVVVLTLIAVGAWLFHQKKRFRKLQGRFGPESDRTVPERPRRTTGESEFEV